MSEPRGAPELSLVMPCYDEEEVVEATVADLFAAFQRSGRRLELVAVDNGSRDRTGEILRAQAGRHPGLVVVRVETNRGYGNGILAGLSRASAAWVGILCADGQVAAPDVAALYERAARSKAPGLYKVRRRFRQDGLRRKIISVVYNLTMLALFPGIGSIDVNGNPKVLPRDRLEAMSLRSTDWFLDAEILLESRRLGLPVIEIDVPGHARGGGASNVRAATIWEFAKNICAFRFRARPARAKSERDPRPKRAGHGS